MIIEQLNIVGKRSGEGFIAHKATLVNALSRAVADRVKLNGITLGRKGLLGYLKALGGSNIVKVIPSNGSASGSQAAGKSLKVICGANTSHLEDSLFIGENTPVTLCDVRVSPNNTVKPNIGAAELAEALARVLPFAAKDDTRPVLQCVNFTAKEGKLILVSADGFRLAVVSLDRDGDDAAALINRDDLKGMVNALKRAKRARVSFADSKDKDGKQLVIDTELIRYRWIGDDGDFPDWQKLVPAEFHCHAHFDTVEAARAVNSLKVLSDSPTSPIDMTIGNGKVIMASPDDKGQAEIPADTDGELKVRLDGGYLSQALKACGGMVELKLTSPGSPMLFSSNGYQLVVMPMLTTETAEAAQEDSETEPEAKAEAEPATEPAPEAAAEPVKPKKAKSSRAKEPTAAH
jgi:DNA polymerase III subunit beta